MQINIPDITVVLKHESCITCGTHFAMDGELMARKREDKTGFYCPNGHSMVYNGTNYAALKEENERLKREEQSLRNRANWAENSLQTEKYSHAATKGKLTKTVKRIAHGVCPCCNRSFTDIRHHMDSKHPEYGDRVKKVEATTPPKVEQPKQENIMHMWGGKMKMKLQTCDVCGKVEKNIEAHYQKQHTDVTTAAKNSPDDTTKTVENATNRPSEDSIQPEGGLDK